MARQQQQPNHFNFFTLVVQLQCLLLLLLLLHFLFYLRVMPKERRHTCTHAHRRALQLYGEYKNRMRANYGQIDVC